MKPTVSEVYAILHEVHASDMPEGYEIAEDYGWEKIEDGYYTNFFVLKFVPTDTYFAVNASRFVDYDGWQEDSIDYVEEAKPAYLADGSVLDWEPV